MENNIYDKRFKDARDAAFLAKAAAEFEKKPFYVRWKGVYAGARPARFVLQLLSAATACTAIAFLSHKFTGSLAAGFCIGGVLVVIIEYVKAFAWGELSRKFLQSNSVPALTLVVALVTVAFSGIASFMGAPKFVALVAQPPQLISIDSLKQHKHTYEDSLRTYYTGRAAALEQKAEQLHDRNKYKGKTVKSVRAEVAAFKVKAESMQDSMHSYVNSYAAGMMQVVSQAEAENAARVQEHKAEHVAFGALVGVSMLVCELLIGFISFFCVFYRYRAVTESGARAEQLQPVIVLDKGHGDGVSTTGFVQSVQAGAVVKQKDEERTKDVLKEEKKKVVAPKCLHCENDFIPRNSGHKYCSKTCKNEAYNKSRRKKK